MYYSFSLRILCWNDVRLGKELINGLTRVLIRAPWVCFTTTSALPLTPLCIFAPVSLLPRMFSFSWATPYLCVLPLNSRHMCASPLSVHLHYCIVTVRWLRWHGYPMAWIFELLDGLAQCWKHMQLTPPLLHSQQSCLRWRMVHILLFFSNMGTWHIPGDASSTVPLP
jgi:hypothetical protein